MLSQPATERGQGEPSNGYDELHVDTAELFRRHPLGQRAIRAALWGAGFDRFYALGLLPRRLRSGAWTVLRRSGIDLAWFQRFRAYWGEVLQGRPLWGPHDFYALRSHYRARSLRDPGLPEAARSSAGAHLGAWQSPAVLSHLCHSVYKESLLNTLNLIAHLRHARRVARILEFGAGAAPVATSLVEFGIAPRAEIVITDLEQISFHYAAWKLAEIPRVSAVALKPESGFSLEGPHAYDAIFCTAVFEHLPAPLQTIREFHRALNPGGVLIFDYIKSEGQGLDSYQGLHERPEVIRFLADHFQIAHGKLDPENSMTLTVAVRR